MFFDRFRAPDTRQRPLLLFDYDGVIADSLHVYFDEFSRACNALGYAHINSREDFLSLFDGNLVRQLIKTGFPLRKLRALASEFAPQIEQANQRIQPFPGMPKTLDRLSARHPVMIITANSAAVVRQFVNKHDLHQIRGIIGSDDETSKVKKIRAARRQFPGFCPYYMGDTKGDMLEAKRARAVPVAIAWGWHDVDRLKQGQPQHVVATQQELLELFDGSRDWSGATVQANDSGR